MVLKALVDAILQSQRDPYNLLHVQLVQTLKKDISHDVTEAFTASQRLVTCQEENVHKTWAAKETELESLKETLRKGNLFMTLKKGL
ncbi:hypothetical protein TNCT_24311 [Trichonephila clavata]|uniref:Uncharacterized protein n=1 Tax=Trichonephila clavata TaxID=2740835 RepID=A0A8X6K6U8_TRICU|nr:hypothetical protein TNCT_24311 [Trichonephila clavata]